VYGGIPGEVADVDLILRRPKHSTGHCAETREPHPARRKPGCKRVFSCGACPLMHLDPAAQLRAKRDILHRELSGQALPLPQTIATAGVEEGYRRTLRVVIGRSPHGRTRIGVQRRDGGELVTIPDCPVTTPALLRTLKGLSFAIHDLDVSPYHDGRGLLRHAVMRQSSVDETVQVTLIATRRARIVDELGRAIQGTVADVSGVLLHINDAPGRRLFVWPDEPGGPRPFRLLSGQPRLAERLGGMRLAIGAGTFFPANPPVAEMMLTDLLADWEDLRERPAVDLYCGVGATTLPLARAHGWAMGVDSVPGVIGDARENASRNKVGATFLEGPVRDLLPEIHQRVAGRGAVVRLDPSRRGVDPEVIEGVRELEPSAVCLVASDPRSLSRDLDGFRAAGFVVRSIRAYDMLPQTPHLDLQAELRPARPPTIQRRGPRRRIARRSAPTES